MQAFGHQVNGFADPDRANMFEQPPTTGGEIGPSPPPSVTKYLPMTGRADRLAANIPGGQSSWGMNGDHMTSGLGGSNH